MYKRNRLILGLLLGTISISVGCHKSVEKPEPVKPVANLSLPIEIAGTWQARESPWRVVLDPNGTVTSALIPMGKVSLKPNATTKVEMRDGSWSTYKSGDFTVSYDAVTRNLLVIIEVKHLEIAYLQNKIEGNSTDRFIGPVSEDGKTWRTDWITVFDYGPRFPQDPNDIYAEPLIFDKVVEEE